MQNIKRADIQQDVTQQDVLALPACSRLLWQHRNKLLSSCNEVNEANRLATGLISSARNKLLTSTLMTTSS